MQNSNFVKVPIELLDFSGRNPRDEIRNLEALAENVAEHGILEPIIIRPKNSRFQVVVGERRVRAATIAGLNEVPALVRTISDAEADEFRLIENVHREDLTDAEKGDAVLGLLDNYPDRYPSFKAVADRLNLNYNTVLNNWVPKAKKLTPRVKESLSREGINEFQVSYLLKHPPQLQDILVDKIRGLTNDQTIRFFRLYSERPNDDLDLLVKEAKGTRTVSVSLDELPPQIAEAVEQIKQKQDRPVFPQTQEVKGKMVETFKETMERRRQAKERQLSLIKPNIEEQLETLKSEISSAPSSLEDELNLTVVSRVQKLSETVRVKKRIALQEDERIRSYHSDEMIMAEFGYTPKIYDVWSFTGRDDRFGLPWPGNIPAGIMFNLLYYFAEEDDLVVDSMAGGGVVVDVCKVMKRRCIAWDIKPCAMKGITYHDALKPFPKSIIYEMDPRGARLVFLDPPYWNMKDEDYVQGSISSLGIVDFYEALAKIAVNAMEILRPDGFLAILLQTQHGRDVEAKGQEIDHILEVGERFKRIGLKPLRRISCPQSSQTIPIHAVKDAITNRYLLGIYRDLWIWRNGQTEV